MPYKNKTLKTEYQKRTATPYMKEWREKNKERQRDYMRQWMSNRRKNKSKVEADKITAQKTGSAKRAKDYNINRQKAWVDGLADIYIIGLLTRRGDLSRGVVMQYPEIIAIHRTYVLTKRQIYKHDHNSYKLI